MLRLSCRGAYWLCFGGTPVVLHQFSYLSIFPGMSPWTLNREDEHGMDEQSNSPTEQRPVKPPGAAAGREVNQEEPEVHDT